MRTIAALLLADAGDEALLDEGEQWAQAADAEGAEEFALAADAFCSTRHIDRPRRRRRAQAEHWAERHGEVRPRRGG